MPHTHTEDKHLLCLQNVLLSSSLSVLTNKEFHGEKEVNTRNERTHLRTCVHSAPYSVSRTRTFDLRPSVALRDHQPPLYVSDRCSHHPKGLS